MKSRKKWNFPCFMLPLTSGGSNGDVVKEEIVNVPSVFPCVLMVRAKSTWKHTGYIDYLFFYNITITASRSKREIILIWPYFFQISIISRLLLEAVMVML
jgi:hypothetical protein